MVHFEGHSRRARHENCQESRVGDIEEIGKICEDEVAFEVRSGVVKMVVSLSEVPVQLLLMPCVAD